MTTLCRIVLMTFIPKGILASWRRLTYQAPKHPRALHTPRLIGCSTLLCVILSTGCAHKVIPNTDVRDSQENREILDFMERYRKAVEAIDVEKLLSLASPDYYDDNGTPNGEDDVDYQALRKILRGWKDEVLKVRYEIRYRQVRFDRDKIIVDVTYTGSFKLRGVDKPRWERRLADNRFVLKREGDFRILTGM